MQNIPESVRLNSKVDKTLRQEVYAAAARRRWSISNFLRAAARFYLDNIEEETIKIKAKTK